MTTISARLAQIIVSLRNKAYRDALVAEGIDEHIPSQIRAMRQARGWSQKELAKRLDMTQHGVSRLENPNYGRFTLATLKRLAPVFDVALVVRYVPFSEYATWMAALSPEDLAVPDYEHEPGLHMTGVHIAVKQTTNSLPIIHEATAGPNVRYLPLPAMSRNRVIDRGYSGRKPAYQSSSNVAGRLGA